MVEKWMFELKAIVGVRVKVEVEVEARQIGILSEKNPRWTITRSMLMANFASFWTLLNNSVAAGVIFERPNFNILQATLLKSSNWSEVPHNCLSGFPSLDETILFLSTYPALIQLEFITWSESVWSNESQYRTISNTLTLKYRFIVCKRHHFRRVPQRTLSNIMRFINAINKYMYSPLITNQSSSYLQFKQIQRQSIQHSTLQIFVFHHTCQ